MTARNGARRFVAAVLLSALVALAGSSRAEPVRPVDRIGGAGAPASAAMRAGAVTAGLSHTCALTTSGGVKCWGYNGHDELGTGRGNSLLASSRPVAVASLGGITAISAGLRHSCALTGGGGVRCWGYNRGALGDGTPDRRFVPVDVVGLSSGVTAVSAGGDYGCALTGAGGVKCWGLNALGQLGDGTTENRFTPVDVSGLGGGMRAIDAGGPYTCAVTGSGGVKCWGYHYGLTPADVPGLESGVSAISGLCALTDAGGVKCWGGDYGWTPVAIAGLTRGVTAIASSGGHSCALTSAGRVKCWGLNDHGQLGDGTRIDRGEPTAVPGLGAVTAITAGYFHTCALMRAGNVMCWGGNDSGQLGDGPRQDRLRPAAVVGFTALVLPTHTPGARSSTVTQATIRSTICAKGWAAKIRPPKSYTNRLKRQQLAKWQYADQNPAHHEEDHLISLELGGAPRSTRNLWPEPWSQARKSDLREQAWHRQVCNGRITLERAQTLELAYKRAHG